MRRGCWLLMAVGLLAGPLGGRASAVAVAAPAAGDVSVRATLDRPAIWVADRVTYTIAIDCSQGVDILADDLARDKLKVSGLEVIGSDVARQVDGDKTHYAFHYVLTTYRVDASTLTIAPLSVRYFVRRPGMRPEEATPAGSVQVPGAVVARRSLLPDEQAIAEVRDRRPAEARPALFVWLQPVGVGLLLLSTAPVVLLAFAIGRRLYARRGMHAAPSARQLRHALRERLEVVRQTDPADATARREAFAQLDALVRDHLHTVSGLPAPSLTSREIAGALDPEHSRLPADLVGRVLSTCELARYAPPDRLPPADAWRDTLADAEQVLATR